MNNDLTLVTAFYDIGRESKYDGRDAVKYLEYFDFVANLQNPLIVFTTKEFENQILEIRKKKGLEELTIVRVVEMQDLLPGFVDRTRRTFERFDQSIGRKNPKNIECTIPDYCCVNCLKPFYVKRAYDLELICTQYVAWIDFGFNHGGEYYADNGDFAFSLTAEKFIKLFDLHNTNMAIFRKRESIESNEDIKAVFAKNVMALYSSMEVPFIGGLMIGTQKGWRSLASLYKEGVEHFLALGAMDDDQSVLYYAYITNPQMFEIIDCFRFFDSLDLLIPEECYSTISVTPPRKKNICH